MISSDYGNSVHTSDSSDGYSLVVVMNGPVDVVPPPASDFFGLFFVGVLFFGLFFVGVIYIIASCDKQCSDKKHV